MSVLQSGGIEGSAIAAILFDLPRGYGGDDCAAIGAKPTAPLCGFGSAAAYLKKPSAGMRNGFAVCDL
jgi:hypothetical protein